MKALLLLVFGASYIAAQNPVIAYPITASDVGTGTKVPEILPPEKPGMPQVRARQRAERPLSVPTSKKAPSRADERAAIESRAALESNIKTDEYSPAD